MDTCVIRTQSVRQAQTNGSGSKRWTSTNSILASALQVTNSGKKLANDLDPSGPKPANLPTTGRDTRHIKARSKDESSVLKSPTAQNGTAPNTTPVAGDGDRYIAFTYLRSGPDRNANNNEQRSNSNAACRDHNHDIHCPPPPGRERQHTAPHARRPLPPPLPHLELRPMYVKRPDPASRNTPPRTNQRC